jgi:hypothetical protein
MTQQQRKLELLPASMPILLCSRVQAATSLGIAPSTFDRLRKSHAILKPVRIGCRPLWPLRNLEAFVAELIDGVSDADDAWIVSL